MRVTSNSKGALFSGTLVLLLACTGVARQEAVPSRDLVSHVTWSVYHEGCRVFFAPAEKPLEDQLRPVKDLRACFLQTQTHNPAASQLIRHASDEVLLQAIQTAVKTIPSTYSLADNFAWVAVHEGQLAAFRRLDKAGAYEGIRAIYATKQLHNPNAHNLLAASRNLDIHQMIVTLLESNPLPINNFVTNRPDESLLVVNPKWLSPEAVASLQIHVFDLLQGTEWPQVEVKEKTSFKSLAEYYYGAGVSSSELGRALPKIQAKNQVQLAETLSAGQRVSLPPVPIVPEGPEKASIIQTIDLLERKVFPKDTATGAVLPYTKSALDQSSSWVLAGPPLLLSALVSNLPPNVQKELKQVAYQGPTYQTANLVLTSSSCNVVESNSNPRSDVTQASQLTITSTPFKYYVLDFFDLTVPPDACPHGKKVLDVIHQNLRSRGVDSLFNSNVIPIELDFFHHQSQQAHYIEDYINAVGGQNKTFLLDVLVALKNRDLSSVKPYETPILYLQAVYYAILKDPNAMVVSSSFYTETDTFKLFPDNFAQNSGVLMLSAVDDNQGDADTFLFEPIMGLYERRRDFPVLLIGGLQRAGTTYGMTSKQGDGVSCLGYANGWGDATTCIRPGDIGTSFSTPSVATMALLARTVLSQTGQNISARDFRDRLLRATNLLASAPQGYVSPGIPNLDWLLVGAPGLMVDSSDHIFTARTITGSVGYTHTAGNAPFTVPFQHGKDGVSALEHVGNTTYIFDNGPAVWVPVLPKSLSLLITLSNGQTKLLSLSDVDNKTFKLVTIF